MLDHVPFIKLTSHLCGIHKNIQSNSYVTGTDCPRVDKLYALACYHGNGLAKNSKIMSMFVLFLCFWTASEDKRDYIDVWIIKIMIKTNQIDMDVYFFQK